MSYKWPEQITIPKTVGAGKWFDDDDSPFCARGMFAVACKPKIKPSNNVSLLSYNDPRNKRFEQVYKTIAEHYCEWDTFGYNDVESLNDAIVSDQQRTLIYCATLAALGYTDGNRKDAIKLARDAGFDV